MASFAQRALLSDQAAFHTAKTVHTPENVTVIEMPPFSPELNPMENLWHYLRSHYWSHRIHEHCDALLDAAEPAA